MTWEDVINQAAGFGARLRTLDRSIDGRRVAGQMLVRRVGDEDRGVPIPVEDLTTTIEDIELRLLCQRLDLDIRFFWRLAG